MVSNLVSFVPRMVFGALHRSGSPEPCWGDPPVDWGVGSVCVSFTRIVTNRAPWVPILNWSPTAFVSARAGNYRPIFYGPLLDQTSVR